jgi:catechol 2,3-dioxygenase-like lactoylglutathione lyase family enzyme
MLVEQKEGAMPEREFRFIFQSRDYEETVAFYRDGLELPVAGGWDRSADDRGTLFRAASGIVEIKKLPSDREYTQLVGVWMAIEVDDVDAAYARIIEKGMPVKQELADQMWGHRDFSVVDPSGVEVVFFRRMRGEG